MTDHDREELEAALYEAKASQERVQALRNELERLAQIVCPEDVESIERVLKETEGDDES